MFHRIDEKSCATAGRSPRIASLFWWGGWDSDLKKKGLRPAAPKEFVVHGTELWVDSFPPLWGKVRMGGKKKNGTFYFSNQSAADIGAGDWLPATAVAPCGGPTPHC
jgi:hypothetical protein